MDYRLVRETSTTCFADGKGIAKIIVDEKTGKGTTPSKEFTGYLNHDGCFRSDRTMPSINGNSHFVRKFTRTRLWDGNGHALIMDRTETPKQTEVELHAGTMDGSNVFHTNHRKFFTTIAQTPTGSEITFFVDLASTNGGIHSMRCIVQLDMQNNIVGGETITTDGRCVRTHDPLPKGAKLPNRDFTNPLKSVPCAALFL